MYDNGVGSENWTHTGEVPGNTIEIASDHIMLRSTTEIDNGSSPQLSINYNNLQSFDIADYKSIEIDWELTSGSYYFSAFIGFANTAYGYRREQATQRITEIIPLNAPQGTQGGLKIALEIILGTFVSELKIYSIKLNKA